MSPDGTKVAFFHRQNGESICDRYAGLPALKFADNAFFASLVFLTGTIFCDPVSLPPF